MALQCLHEVYVGELDRVAGMVYSIRCELKVRRRPDR